VNRDKVKAGFASDEKPSKEKVEEMMRKVRWRRCNRG